jgi:hypothetical protein
MDIDCVGYMDTASKGFYACMMAPIVLVLLVGAAPFYVIGLVVAAVQKRWDR